MTDGMSMQLALEEEMVEIGRQRAEQAVAAAEKCHRGHETPYAKAIIPEIIPLIADALEEWLKVPGAGVRATVRKLLKDCNPKQAAYLALARLFWGIREQQNCTTVCAQIGRAIEDELKYQLFYKIARGYMKTLLKDMKSKFSRDYQHAHKVLTSKANERELPWNDWTQEERAQVGSVLVELLRQNTDLFTLKDTFVNNRRKRIIEPTADLLTWIDGYVHEISTLNPHRMPCLVPPAPWIDFDTGGYFSPGMRQRVKFAKPSCKAHARSLREASLVAPRRAVNAIQATPWRVNKGVFRVMQDVWSRNLRTGLPASEPLKPPACPFPRELKAADMTPDQLVLFKKWKREATGVYELEKERIGQGLLLRGVMQMARRFQEHDRFWFVVQADFRGRMYTCTTGFSPQGPKFGKGLLEFADGMPLGASGVPWFIRHGASMLGFDKASYKDREAHIMGMSEEIRRMARNPLSYRDLWGNADKPWQFLAWALEFDRFLDEGESFVSHLPISLDGSCNGLQHFSAMLRDPVGGAATNLTPGDKPADIYAKVAAVVQRKLEKLKASRDDRAEMAERWLLFGIDRKLCKKPVMTLPYGSTQQACTTGLADAVIAHDSEGKQKCFDDPFQAALFLSPILWKSIGEVVVAAREAMDWIRSASRVIGKHGYNLFWETPLGFPVLNKYPQWKHKEVTTFLMGKSKMVVGMDDGKIDVQRQRNASSPNFVHSMDATHLCMTVNAAHEAGIDRFACIHDDFGTHAAHTEAFQRIIREQFVELYHDRDHLGELKAQWERYYCETLPDTPASGTLDIREVLNSPYFFG